MFQDKTRLGRINGPRMCWVPNGIRPISYCQIVRETLIHMRHVNYTDDIRFYHDMIRRKTLTNYLMKDLPL